MADPSDKLLFGVLAWHDRLERQAFHAECIPATRTAVLQGTKHSPNSKHPSPHLLLQLRRTQVTRHSVLMFHKIDVAVNRMRNVSDELQIFAIQHMSHTTELSNSNRFIHLVQHVKIRNR